MNQQHYPQILDTIIEYISEHVADGIEVSHESNFIAEGLLDSFATLSLIMTLESEFQIKFTPIELANPQLQLVSGLARCVSNKMKGQA